MEFSEIIAKILGDPVRIRVYKILILRPQGASGRELGRLAGTSPFKIHQILKALVAQSVLRETITGRVHLYRLNEEHRLVHDVIRPLIRYEGDLLNRLGNEIRNRFRPKPISVILYGSVARGEERPDSDLDVLLIDDDRRRGKRGRLEAGEALEAVERSFGNPLRLIRMTASEFKMKSRGKDPLIRNILKEGKAISGLTMTEILNYGR